MCATYLRSSIGAERKEALDSGVTMACPCGRRYARNGSIIVDASVESLEVIWRVFAFEVVVSGCLIFVFFFDHGRVRSRMKGWKRPHDIPRTQMLFWGVGKCMDMTMDKAIQEKETKLREEEEKTRKLQRWLHLSQCPMYVTFIMLSMVSPCLFFSSQ